MTHLQNNIRIKLGLTFSVENGIFWNFKDGIGLYHIRNIAYTIYDNINQRTYVNRIRETESDDYVEVSL